MATVTANQSSYLQDYMNDFDSNEPPTRRPNEAPLKPAPARRDELDDLLDYDVDDLLADVDLNMDAPVQANPQSSRNGTGRTGGTDSLGIEETVKVAKSKRVTVKLDDNRLLSQNGIPKLRRTVRQRLKFKGKGHEYSDVQRLLNFYQLWLDDLFPKAKFADALAMVEKLGHTKRIQTMRREWIDEGRPRAPAEAPELKTREEEDNAAGRNMEDASAEVNGERQRTPEIYPVEDDDLYGLSPAANRTMRPQGGDLSSALFVSDNEKDPDEDELDALLTEDSAMTMDRAMKPLAVSTASTEDNFDDDMEAMAEMEGW